MFVRQVLRPLGLLLVVACSNNANDGGSQATHSSASMESTSVAPTAGSPSRGKASVPGSTSTSLWTYQSHLDGDDSIASVAFGPQGAIFVGGQRGDGAVDKWVARFDPAEGSVVWSERYDHGTFESVHELAVTASMIYAVGATQTADAEDIWVSGLDLSGKSLWDDLFSSGFGSDYATAVAALPDGDAVVAGVVSQENSLPGALWVRRYSPRGSSLWTHTLPGVESPLYALGPGISANDERVVVSFSRFVAPDLRPELLVAYPLGGGAPSWTVDIPETKGTAYGVAHSAGNSLMIASRHNFKELTVRRVSSDGEVVEWSSAACAGSTGRAVAVDRKGDVVVIGDGPGEKGTDIRLCKFSSDGTLRWSKNIDGGFGDDRGHGLAISSQGDIVAGGSVTDAGGRLDAWLAMFSP